MGCKCLKKLKHVAVQVHLIYHTYTILSILQTLQTNKNDIYASFLTLCALNLIMFCNCKMWYLWNFYIHSTYTTYVNLKKIYTYVFIYFILQRVFIQFILLNHHTMYIVNNLEKENEKLVENLFYTHEMSNFTDNRITIWTITIGNLVTHIFVNIILSTDK